MRYASQLITIMIRSEGIDARDTRCRVVISIFAVMRWRDVDHKLSEYLMILVVVQTYTCGGC